MATSPPSPAYDRLFVSGDSLSDPGNVFELTSTLADAFPFLLDPVPPSPPYFRGRFSNGPVWAEKLADRLDLAGQQVDNVAVGGAETDGHTAVEGVPGFFDGIGELVGLTGLKAQVDQYLAADGEISADGLHVLWGGANDYLFGDAEIPAMGLPATVANLRSAARDLADAGARQFLIPNLPDLGRLPSTRNDANAGELTAAAAAHNAALAETFAAFASARALDVHILDVARFFDAALEGAFGFTSLEPCRGAAEGCDGALFFDGVHPTAAAHALLGDIADAALKLPTAPTLLAPALVAALPEEPESGRGVLGAAMPAAAGGAALAAGTALTMSSAPAGWPAPAEVFLIRAADGFLRLQTGDGRVEERIEGDFGYVDGTVQGVVRDYSLRIDGRVEVEVEGAGADAEALVGALKADAAGTALAVLLGGDDRIVGSNAADPSLRGFAGDDHVLGDGGDDLLGGGAGDDLMRGNAGDDRLVGWNGRDELFGGVGADALAGGAGDDMLDGGIGEDRLDGGAGADRIVAGKGADLARGGPGDDVLRGWGGPDTLVGGPGDDILTGGRGADRFVYDGGRDRITDFAPGDEVVVDALWFAASGGGALPAGEDRAPGAVFAFGADDVLTVEGASVAEVAPAFTIGDVVA